MKMVHQTTDFQSRQNSLLLEKKRPFNLQLKRTQDMTYASWMGYCLRKKFRAEYPGQLKEGLLAPEMSLLPAMEMAFLRILQRWGLGEEITLSDSLRVTAYTSGWLPQEEKSERLYIDLTQHDELITSSNPNWPMFQHVHSSRALWHFLSPTGTTSYILLAPQKWEYKDYHRQNFTNTHIYIHIRKTTPRQAISNAARMFSF